MKCPNCDGEMIDDIEEGVWVCEECGYEEDRS